MNHKYLVIVILVLLFGVTLAVSAYSPLEKIDSTDTLKIKENVVIIKQSDFTTPYET